MKVFNDECEKCRFSKGWNRKHRRADVVNGGVYWGFKGGNTGEEDGIEGKARSENRTNDGKVVWFERTPTLEELYRED